MAKYIHPSNSKGVKKQNRAEDPEGQRDHCLRMVNLSVRCLGDKRHMHADSWAQVVLIKCLITTTHLTELSEFKVSVLETRRRQWHPTPVPLPGKSHGPRSLVGCSLWGREVRHDWATSLSLLCIGEGNGNPLQCSCLENPRDGVAQSWTWLKWLSSSSSSSAWNYQSPWL